MYFDFETRLKIRMQKIHSVSTRFMIFSRVLAFSWYYMGHWDIGPGACERVLLYVFLLSTHSV